MSQAGDLRIAVLGTGRMGRLVIAEVLEADDLALAAVMTRPGSASLGIDAGVLAGRGACGVEVSELCPVDADVLVDFSLPDGLRAALPLLGEAALVSGTTGLDEEDRRLLQRRAERGPVLHAANFSTGVNLLLDLVAQAAKALPDYDLEIVESHHHHKRDAPSGTALALGRSAAEARGVTLEDVVVHGRHGDTGARPPGQIGMHALRLGDVAGEHTVTVAGPGERLVLGHVASSRQTFASGAVRAARWIAGRPAGTYSMRDVLGLHRG